MKTNEMGNKTKRPLWFAFPGMGTQRQDAGRDLIRIPAFAAAIERAHEALRPYDVDLKWILTEAPKFNDYINSMVSITATQVALVNVLREIGLNPDGIIGLSLGELGCAYADGTLTVEQTVLAAYWIGRSLVNTKLPLGLKAVVNLEWDQCKKRCPPDVELMGNFVEGSCVITGNASIINDFVETLNSEGVVSRVIGTKRLMFHTKYLLDAAPALQKHLEAIIPSPKSRSARWISSFLPEDKWDPDKGKLSSAGYFVNDLQSPFDMLLASRIMTKNAIFVEISAHPKLATLMKPSLPAFVTTIELIQEAPDDVIYLLEAIEKIFKELGSHHTKTDIARALELSNEAEKLIKKMADSTKKRSLWFVFPGLGTQRIGAVRDLIKIPVFAAAIERAAAVLSPYDIDLIWTLTEASSFTNVIHSMVSITATQVALVDVLYDIGLRPDGFFGVSLGELGAAYADGALTIEQAVLAAYWIGYTLVHIKLPLGATAIVNVSWDKCKNRCPDDVDLVGSYSESSIVITGSNSSIVDFVETLNSEGHDTHIFGTGRLMYHSRYMLDTAPDLRKYLEAVIPKPKLRSARWISTFLPDEKWDSDKGTLCSAGYFVNDMQSPFDMPQASRAMPENAVLFEVSAYPKLAALIKACLPPFVTIVDLPRGNPDDVQSLFEAIEKISVETGQLDICHTKTVIAQALGLLNEEDDSCLIGSKRFSNGDHRQEQRRTPNN